MGAPKPWRSAGRWMTPNRAALGRLDCIAYHGGSLAMPVLAAQDSRQCRSFSPARSYDYIIVGAGSSGYALAHRLTEDDGVRLLLLEAGGWDRDPWLKIPLAAGVGLFTGGRH